MIEMEVENPTLDTSADNMFCNMDLSGKKFEREDFKGALFSDVDLKGTEFHMCDLSDAVFTNCLNIESTSFKRCNLEGTLFDDIRTLKHHSACPSHGQFIGWKATLDAIVKLSIPEDAIRINPIGSRHCRVSKALVLAIHDRHGNVLQQTKGKFFGTVYKVGKTIADPDINTDEREWCERGIGIFITKKEAEEFF